MSASSNTEFGWSNGEAPFYHKYLIGAIEELLQDAPESREEALLDVGCGNGYFANKLITKGYNAYGIDASTDGIVIANQCNPGRFFVHDVNGGGLPEALKHIRFRTVISMEVIEHLYSPRRFVDFMKEILMRSGGGMIILSTPYHGYVKNVALAIAAKMDYHWGPLWEGGHIKFWSKRTLTTLLMEAGFRNVEFRCVGRFPYLWRHMVCRAQIG